MFDFWVSRVVSEVHCCATKKNKEWQEKLPIVVLKAEEILYSKADSKVPFFFFWFFDPLSKFLLCFVIWPFCEPE